MIWKPHKWYFFGQEPHKWHLSWRLNQQVTQQLESNSPMGINVSNSPHNLHKNWKLTPQMAQKLETYPTNGRKVGNLPHKWQKSWKLTLQMAQKLETQPTSGTKVGNSPHKWHKGSRQVFRLQWLAQCRRSLTESNKLYMFYTLSNIKYILYTYTVQSQFLFMHFFNFYSVFFLTGPQRHFMNPIQINWSPPIFDSDKF